MCDGHDHHHDHVHDHVHDDRLHHSAIGHKPVETVPKGGAPVLDIGGEIGALVVLLDEEAVGTELFLRPEGVDHATTHTGIWRRRFGDTMVPTAVFMALQEGTYWILRADGTDQERVEIIGAEMLQLDRQSVRAA